MSGPEGAPTRWRIDLEYDGTEFAGWQVQPGQRTVQGVVAEAASALFGGPVTISGAGRTDAGVHALQQVASFVSSVRRTEEGVLGGLNAHLPSDVACTAARVVPPDFDPRRAPHAKRYVYTWLDRRARSPLLRGRAWHVRHRLDDEAMARAVAALVGTHDCSSFRAAGCASTHAVRTIRHAEVVRHQDRVQLALHGTGFLRHMVRIVAGTLREVGRGKQHAGWFTEVLQACDRTCAGPTAPAAGLCLEWIRYEDADRESGQR